MNHSVERILRVDHAGERGATSIYRAQIAVCKLLHKSCVPALLEMLSHEERHLQTFQAILKQRGLRACRALSLWAVGGWLLGTTTALLGERAIWVCTAAVENTVNKHLRRQIEFLNQQDDELLAAVHSIQHDEIEHELRAFENRGQPTGAYILVWKAIVGATSFAIWLSARL